MTFATNPTIVEGACLEWSERLTRDYLYSPTQLEHRLDYVAVSSDEAGRKPLALIAPEANDPSALFAKARREGFPLAAYGPASAPQVFALGHFERGHTRISALPTWMPRHPRVHLVPREVMLLPFRADDDLRSAFQTCHDAVYKALANDPAATFDLVLLTLAAKILDERDSSKQHYQFATVHVEDAAARSNRFNRLLDEAHEWLDGYQASTGAVPSVSPSLAWTLLRIFQDYSLTLTADSAGGTDVVGTAYEAIVGSTFRGELGSYFTPKTIADFIAQMVGSDAQKVLDPACGSAGLLLALHRSQIDGRGRVSYFGNDLNPRMVRAAKVNFLLHGLDPGQVLQGNGLELDRILRDTLGVETGSGAWWDAVPDGPFDAVVANPPFAGHEADSELLERIAVARKSNGDLRSLNRTLPFIEAIIAALRDGGTAALVLPTSILNAEEDTFVRLRELLLERTEIVAIIGMPENAFVHTDCGIHGLLLFLRRAHRPRREYDVFVDWASHLGYDRLGRYRRENDFPDIINRYRSDRWLEANSYPISWLRDAGRWDPAWLKVSRSLPRPGSSEADFVQLTSLLEVRPARFSRRGLDEDALYRFFEVADTDLISGEILRVHETTGFELRKKGRIKNRVQAGDLLLPNHRDSLIAKGAPTGRSAVIVSAEFDGVLTTDRFLILRPLIDPVLLQALLNSAGARRQIVSQCRGAASLDIRERILQQVLIPRAAVEGSAGSEIITQARHLVTLRLGLLKTSEQLSNLVEATFGGNMTDFRPSGRRQP